MLALIGYPCCRNNFTEVLIEPKMIAWETALAIAILALGIIGKINLFPQSPAAAALIAFGSISLFVAFVRGCISFGCHRIQQKNNEQARHLFS